jgi:membrane-bound lytic murein transglycosylase F
MQKFRNFKLKKRHRWIIFPLLIIVIVVAMIRSYFFPEKPAPKDALRRIYERGYLIALTNTNSLNYFIYNGQPMGFQLELLQSFGDYLDVPVKIIAVNDLEKLYYYLDLNVADVFAFNLPVSGGGKKLVHFSQALGETRQVLIQRKASQGKAKGAHVFIREYKDFKQDTIIVANNPFQTPLLKTLLRKAGHHVTLIEEKEKNPEELVRMVSQGKINFTICDENLAMVLKRYYQNIDANVALSLFTPYAWGVRSSSDSLLMKIDSWLTQIKAKGSLKYTTLSYFNNPRITVFFNSNNFTLKTDRLSPFDAQLRTLSKMISWDWRLLASLIYEESNFITGLTSSHNATGLMQLMPETARKFGMDSASSPSQQLVAGVRFLHWLDQQLLPEIMDRKERINFILASYNVGMGKVLAARKKAAQNGRDPNKWNNNVEYFLIPGTRLGIDASPDIIIGNSPFGTAGSFVSNILERYHHYKNNLPK